MLRGLLVGVSALAMMAGVANAQLRDRDGNHSEIFQENAGNHATVDQSAGMIGSFSLIEQIGMGNKSNVTQLDDGGYVSQVYVSESEILQSGNENIADVIQRNSDSGDTWEDANWSFIEQTGTSSTASVNQDGSGSNSHIEQHGMDESAVVDQRGAGLNYSSIIQDGELSNASAKQSSEDGSQAFSNIEQANVQNLATVEQTAIGGVVDSYIGQVEGSNLVATVTQNGGELFSTVIQSGRMNTATVTQTGYDQSSTIEQWDRNNTATVIQTGGTRSSEISQSGDNHVANVHQSGIAPAHSFITQTGVGNVATVNQ